MANNEKLTEEQKTFVVQSLACFDSPAVVAAAVKREFGVEISRQSVEAYDPTKRAGRNLAAKWSGLFEETRKAFLEKTAAIGIANVAVRLRWYERMAQAAESRGNLVLAAALLKQAAEDLGGAYTNRRKLEHMGEGGGPVKTEDVGAREAAREEVQRRIAELASRTAVAGGSGGPE